MTKYKLLFFLKNNNFNFLILVYKNFQNFNKLFDYIYYILKY